jgi:SAM-dependent methyltransferase
MTTNEPSTSTVAVAEKTAFATVGSRDKTVAWYNPKLENLPEETKELLKTYSQIPEGEIEAHVHKVVSNLQNRRLGISERTIAKQLQRDEAWEVWPFPCIGQFRFLTLALPNTPSFKAIVHALQASPEAKFLDLGCCFGQDLRALAALGVKGESLIGVELHGEFHDLGHKLFRDGGEMRTLGAELIAADVFDLLKGEGEQDTAVALRPLLGRIDVLQASAFLHLFTWEKQVDAGSAIVKLMKPGSGALVVGTQVGSKKPGLYEQGRMYLHDVESLERLWREIGEKTGSEWRVDAVLAQDPREKKPWDDGSVGKLNFEVTRVR